jgi:hypothetical protein
MFAGDLMKGPIIRVLAFLGISLGRCADVQLVRRLISRLRPVTTDKGLIRLGGDGDGGYVIPDDLDGVVACFSPGVGAVATFEAALVARGVHCYLADASVSGPPITDAMVHFDKKFLGVIDDDTTITLDTWVKLRAPADGDLILQMDIEAAEWVVLLNVSEAVLKRFRIIVVELHSLERLIDRMGFELMFATLERLLQQFYVIHSHPNNVARPFKALGVTIPRLLEMTFLRRDRAQVTGCADQFPNALDRKNVPERADFVLPAEWH